MCDQIGLEGKFREGKIDGFPDPGSEIVRMGRSRLCLVVIIKEELIAERLSQVDRRGKRCFIPKERL